VYADELLIENFVVFIKLLQRFHLIQQEAQRTAERTADFGWASQSFAGAKLLANMPRGRTAFRPEFEPIRHAQRYCAGALTPRATSS